MFHIKSQGQKLVPLEKYYLPYDWIYDANICMTDAKEVISRNVKGFYLIIIFAKLLHARKGSIFDNQFPT